MNWSNCEEDQPFITREEKPQFKQKGDGVVELEEPESFCRRIPIIGTTIKLYEKYDNTLLTVVGIVYFNQGMKVLVSLAVADLFKAYYHEEPGHVQALISFSMIPWSIKLLYGLISDNVPILGSRRKSYLLIMSFAQFLSMGVIGSLAMTKSNESFAVWALFFANLAGAF